MAAKVAEPKKKYNVKGTRRQKLATKIITENHDIPLSVAMRQAGYPENTAKKPENLTGSEYYQWVQQELQKEFNNAGFNPAAYAQNITRIAFTSQKRDQYSGEMYSDDAKQLDAMKYGAEAQGWLKTVGDTNILVNVQPIYALETE